MIVTDIVAVESRKVFEHVGLAVSNFAFLNHELHWGNND